MDCAWTRDRLVALQDGEVAPSEFALLTEHLESCDACAAYEERLARATPQPFLVVPAEVQWDLERAVDEAVSAALSEPVPLAPAQHGSWMRWLRRDRDLSNGAMVAYGLLMAACLAWGLSNYMTLQTLQQPLPASDIAAAPAAQEPGVTIAPDQYRPASYTPEEGEEPWR